jgi:hypothetical protein
MLIHNPRRITNIVMNHTLTLLTALLLAPLAALHAGRSLPEVPNLGKLRVGSFIHWKTVVR